MTTATASEGTPETRVPENERPIDRVGEHMLSTVGAVETRPNPPCIANWKRCLAWIKLEIDRVKAEIADTTRKEAHGPVAQAVKDQILALHHGELADLEASEKSYLGRIGTLRGDLVDVDRLLGVTSEKSPKGTAGNK